MRSKFRSLISFLFLITSLSMGVTFTSRNNGNGSFDILFEGPLPAGLALNITLPNGLTTDYTLCSINSYYNYFPDWVYDNHCDIQYALMDYGIGVPSPEYPLGMGHPFAKIDEIGTIESTVFSFCVSMTREVSYYAYHINHVNDSWEIDWSRPIGNLPLYDLNMDGIVEINDMVILNEHWHWHDAPFYVDFNGDGIVNMIEFEMMNEGHGLNPSSSGVLMSIQVNNYDAQTDYDDIEITVNTLRSDPQDTPDAFGIFWHAVKLSENYGDKKYVIVTHINTPSTKNCWLKGPSMTDYMQAEWLEGLEHWKLQIDALTVSELQQQGLGIWELKLIHDDDEESVHSFLISGVLDEHVFLPVPAIIEPSYNASNIIAQNYQLQWNANEAHIEADGLSLELSGEDCFYFTFLNRFNFDDLSLTQWRPGWLELGNAYAKIGYTIFRPDMMQNFSHISGPESNWLHRTVFLTSGDRTDFSVKFSLDFNEDGIIDLADMAVMFSHWLESR